MNNIKKARLNKGYTQTELAEKLGISTVSVWMWETGKRFPRMTRLKQIADILGTEPYKLLPDFNGKEVG